MTNPIAVDIVGLAATFIATVTTVQWFFSSRYRKRAEERVEELEEQVENLQDALEGKPPGSGPFRTNTSVTSPPIKSSRLYPYQSGSDKNTDVLCPMCGGLQAPTACECPDHIEPHLHQTCDEYGCKFRFAMQSRISWIEEKKDKK